MSEKATLNYNGKSYELPVIKGTENETGLDISSLRKESGLVTLDYGYLNTGSTKSSITYVDGENGILRYRGYSIEDLAEKATFPETAWLLIYGDLPNPEQLSRFPLYHMDSYSTGNPDLERVYTNSFEAEENSWYEMVNGQPCFEVEYLLYQPVTVEQVADEEPLGHGDMDGYYKVYVNVETGVIEEYEYNSALAGEG